jgi:hypothetical protein
MRIEKFIEKRKQRLWEKRVKYDVRKVREIFSPEVLELMNFDRASPIAE